MARHAQPNANYRSMSVIVQFYVLAEKELPHSVVILKRTAGYVKNASALFYEDVSNSDNISEYNQELAVKIIEPRTNCENTNNIKVREIHRDLNERKKVYQFTITKLL
jgi:hypothetical protein